MKVGILTFHWATNHGAILQTYASVKYLSAKGCKVQVIDYFPKNRELNFRKLFSPHYPSVMLSRIPQLLKEKRLSSFRKNLPLTKRYFSNQQLIVDPPDFDLILCGSDQIWNPSYALLGEGRITPVYFLNFGKPDCKKAALSVSFGCEKYPKNAELAVKQYVQAFDCISVRENSGISILENMGIKNAHVTADPTALLSSDEYLDICENIPINKSKNMALCILRKQDSNAKELIKSLILSLNIKNVNNLKNKSMETWLAGIRDATVVVTNSFHCVMMCLKLHTPFWVLLENGTLSGMNDRMYTLLEYFGLTERIIISKSQLAIDSNINWSDVDKQMKEYSNTLIQYLQMLTNNNTIPAESKISIEDKKDEIEHIAAYAVKSLDDSIRLNSSSGGVFTLLAEKVLNSGGVVYGAAFSQDCKSVKHIEVDSKDGLKRLRGSKYIQSDLSGVYNSVFERLQRGKLVLFTGTPCQISALKTFLKKDYDNLICQDVVCHGTPVSEVWKQYANALEDKKKSNLIAVSFRDKQNGWRNYKVKYSFENGKVISKPSSEDMYMKGFLSNLFLKPSCYNCLFKGDNNKSDITLADFWGIEEIIPEFSDNTGVSLVVLKTEKGKQLFDNIAENISFVETDLNKSIVYNISILCSADKNPNREDFLSELGNEPIDKLLKKYCKTDFKVYLMRIGKRLIVNLKSKTS